MMLSLPSGWDYSVAGLVSICKEEETAIKTALQELEKHKYLTRTRIRDAKGKIVDIEYNIFEQPLENTEVYPEVENPLLDNPIMENQVQLNKDLNNNRLNNLSIYDAKEKNDFFKLEEEIKEHIEYDIYCEDKSNIKYMNAVVSAMLDILTTENDTVIIGKKRIPTELAKETFTKIRSPQVDYVINNLKENTTNIRNIKSYLQTSLYNSISYLDLDVASKVQYLMCN